MYVDPYWQQFEQPIDLVHYLIGILLIIIGIFGLVFNLIVIIYYLKYESKKNTFNYLLINLSICDLLFILTLFPMIITSNLKLEWLFKQFGCNLYGILGGLFGFTQLCTLSLISIERFLILKNPFYSLNNLNYKRIFVIILFTWLYGLAWILVPYVSKDGSDFVLEGFLTSCTFNFLDQSAYNRTLILSMISGGFFVPITIMSFCYIQLIIKLKTHVNINNDILLRSSSNARSNLNYSKSQLKVTKNIIIYIIVFVMSWGPYALIALLGQFLSYDIRPLYINKYTTYIPSVFAKTSVFTNPLIYVLNNYKIRNRCKFIINSLFNKTTQIRTQNQNQLATGNNINNDTYRLKKLLLRPNYAEKNI